MLHALYLFKVFFELLKPIEMNDFRSFSTALTTLENQITVISFSVVIEKHCQGYILFGYDEFLVMMSLKKEKKPTFIHD